MQPILIIVLAAASGVPLGLWLRHSLATLKYRNVDEQDLPDPGPRWWVVWASVLTLGSLTAAAVLSHDPIAYLSLLPLAVAGPWLAAVDFDVLRIPNRVLVPTAIATLLTVGVIAAVGRDWRALITPLVAALATGAVFAAVHFATKGGIGFGDVKLAAVNSLAMGSLGNAAVWLSVLAGSVAALIWRGVRRNKGPIPFAPWLLIGAWFAGLATALPT